MSVFKVKLNSTTQGTMDISPITGAQMTVSNQRTVYVMGPNRINRKLIDGETFTDSNYWKKFVSVEDGGTCVPAESAFLSIETDDGSIWNDITKTSSNFARSTTLTGDAGSTYATAGNSWNIYTLYGNYAEYTRIHNTGASGTVTIRINGVASFTLNGTEEIIFDHSDLPITMVEVNNTASGAVASPIDVLSLIKSPINS